MATTLRASLIALGTALPLAATAAGFNADAANNPPADGPWHRHRVPLSTAAGGTGSASLAAVLAPVTSRTIKGEFHAGVSEAVGMDNIGVTAALRRKR